MCPDQKMITMYLDGELSDELKDIIESHITLCSACSKIIKEQKTVVASIRNNSNTFQEDTISERLWVSLQRKTTIKGSASILPKISLPFPIALAAAALVLFLGVAYIVDIRTSGLTRLPAQASNNENIKDKNLDEVLDYLMSEQVSNIKEKNSDEVLDFLMSNLDVEVNIIIPDDSGFNFTGEPEPTLLRAAEYGR